MLNKAQEKRIAEIQEQVLKQVKECEGLPNDERVSKVTDLILEQIMAIKVVIDSPKYRGRIAKIEFTPRELIEVLYDMLGGYVANIQYTHETYEHYHFVGSITKPTYGHFKGDPIGLRVEKYGVPASLVMKNMFIFNVDYKKDEDWAVVCQIREFSSVRGGDQ